MNTDSTRFSAVPSGRSGDASGGRSRGRPHACASLLLAAGVAFAGVIASGPVVAQSAGSEPQTMTVEELERHIADQKKALERVRENRDITAEKAREVREALAEREMMLGKTEAELEVLCQEREEIEPGSYEECAAAIGESAGESGGDSDSSGD